VDDDTYSHGPSRTRRGGNRPIERRAVSARALGGAELTIAMTTVGSSAAVGKMMVEGLPVFLGATVRFAIAAAILVPFVVWRHGGMPRLSRGDLGILLLQALTGVFGFSVCWLLGLRLTSASEAGIIASGTPAIVAIASVVLLGDRLVRREVVATVCVVAGVVLMAILGGSAGAASGSQRLAGDGLIVGATIGEALFIVLGKRSGLRVDPLVIATAVTVYGLVLFLPFGIYEAATTGLSEAPTRAWVAAIYYAVGPTVVGYLLLYRGLARMSASTAAVFTGVVPVTAVLFSWLLLGESPLWSHGIGVAAVLIGIILASLNDGQHPWQGVRGGWRGLLPGRVTPMR